MRNLWPFLVILCATSSFAAKNVRQVKDKLSNYRNKLSKMEAELNQIDKELQQYNSNYLSDQGKLNGVEESLAGQKTELENTAGEISKKFSQTKKAYLHFLMEAQDEHDENQVFKKKLYLEVLKVQIDSLKKAQNRSQKILAQINAYEQRVTEFKKREDSIYQYIIGLENKKKEIGQDYINLMEEKNTLEAELDKLLAKKRAYKKVTKTTHSKFGLPLANFDQIKKGKKGLTLKYRGTQPVKSPGAGTVVYVGELASYGQVIIVDHGSDIKSVLLGDMKVKVKKGEIVKINQILGYTVSDEEIAKSIYFEVRKKDKAQNTAQWINPNQQSKIL